MMLCRVSALFAKKASDGSNSGILTQCHKSSSVDNLLKKRDTKHTYAKEKPL